MNAYKTPPQARVMIGRIGPMMHGGDFCSSHSAASMPPSLFRCYIALLRMILDP